MKFSADIINTSKTIKKNNVTCVVVCSYDKYYGGFSNYPTFYIIPVLDKHAKNIDFKVHAYNYL